MAEVIVGSGTRFWMDDDRIIHGKSSPGGALQLDQARESMELQRKMAGGKPYGLLMDISAMRSMSREARAFFALPSHSDILRAVALIVRSPISRVIGNFFLGLNKPVMPTRLFTEEEPALAWLKTLVREP